MRIRAADIRNATEFVTNRPVYVTNISASPANRGLSRFSRSYASRDIASARV